MPVNDRREPGVYVTIEDASYVAPAAIAGRSVFMVGLCPYGPHNQVVTVTSQQEFQNLFGEPDHHVCSQSHYNMNAAMALTNQGLYIRVVPDDAKVANTAIEENGTPVEEKGTSGVDYYTFTEGSATVQCSSETAFGLFSVGDWIYCADGIDTTAEAKQIISVDDTIDTYTLESEYAGATTGWVTKDDTGNLYTPYIETHDSQAWDTEYSSVSDVDPEVVFKFWTTGAGTEKYNKMKIKGVRNSELEKMYVDDDGNVLWKYMFMNVAVYEEQDDGSDILLEGPWTVSLAEKTPDGATIRDLTSGNIMFMPEVINNRSTWVRCQQGSAAINLSLPSSPINNPVSESNRLQTMLMMSSSVPVSTSFYVPLGNTLSFANGENGTTNGQPLYDSTGNLYQDTEIWGKCQLAYQGSMTSLDGSIEQLREVTYPWFEPDYIVTGGFPTTVQEGGRFLADYRQDCFHIGDTGYQTSYSADLDARLNDVPWNNWTSMLYVQYREITDPYTGTKLWINPCYHAIQRHLSIDASYFIAEPVANIEKGAISEAMTLAYKANHTERGDLLDVELNPVIVEPQGQYLLSQLTTWKRLSILKRAHAAKFVAYVRKMVPPLLKDILQRRATQYWINQAQSRVDNFLSRFQGSITERYDVLDSYDVQVEFDDVASELNVLIKMKPLRVIERINVYIIVQ